MILSAQSIELRVRRSLNGEFDLAISPFCYRAIANGMSFGLSACGYDLRIKEELALGAGGCALATTMEYLRLPYDLRGVLADKSSWARRHISVLNTRFEPGWRGYPTIEICNHSGVVIRIPAGAPIAQIEFALLDKATEQPYDGKYQDQMQEPVGAIDE